MSTSASAGVDARVRVLVVDDEPLARATLRILLAGDPDAVCVGECARGADAVRQITSDDPDVVFLDVQMPGGNGFEVLAALGDARRAEVIFVTAFDEHALRAFEVRALDYLLKPFDDGRFERAFARAKARVRTTRLEVLARQMGALVDGARPSAPPAATPLPPSTPMPVPATRIVVRSAGKSTLVDVREIEYVEAEDYYVHLHLDGESHLHREPMRDLEDRLPGHFVRIHRSLLVNAERIRELRTPTRGEPSVILKSGAELRVSRSGKQRLDAVLASRR